MPKYRLKSVEARQIKNYDLKDLDDIVDWINANHAYIDHESIASHDNQYLIITLRGVEQRYPTGDWVVTGGNGIFSFITNTTFENIYEPAEDADFEKRVQDIISNWYLTSPVVSR